MEENCVPITVWMRQESIERLLRERVPTVEVHLIPDAERGGYRLGSTSVVATREQEFKKFFLVPDWSNPMGRL